MKLGKTLGVATAAFILMGSAASAAPLAPFQTDAIRAMNDSDVLAVGYRYREHHKFHGGISYVGDYGLKYAPSYWRHRHHGTDVSVNIYFGPQPERKETGRTRPLIIELPK